MSKPRLVFATRNPGKVREIAQMLSDHYDIVGLDAIGCTEDIPETAPTIPGNAIQKAEYVLEHYGALYPSPGYLSERIELFYAEVEGDPHPLELDHDEQLEPTWMSEAAFEAAVANGEIVDAKTLGAWLRYTVWRKTTHA